MNFGKRTREVLERKRLASLAVEYRHLKDIVSAPHQRVTAAILRRFACVRATLWTAGADCWCDGCSVRAPQVRRSGAEPEE